MVDIKKLNSLLEKARKRDQATLKDLDRAAAQSASLEKSAKKIASIYAASKKGLKTIDDET